MVEVICEDCHTVQRTSVADRPKCERCGSRSLTGTSGYGPVDSIDA